MKGAQYAHGVRGDSAISVTVGVAGCKARRVAPATFTGENSWQKGERLPQCGVRPNDGKRANGILHQHTR